MSLSFDHISMIFVTFRYQKLNVVSKIINRWRCMIAVAKCALSENWSGKTNERERKRGREICDIVISIFDNMCRRERIFSTDLSHGVK